MKSNWLGPGPRVAEREEASAAAVGAAHGVSTNSGTAGPGRELGGPRRRSGRRGDPAFV